VDEGERDRERRKQQPFDGALTTCALTRNWLTTPFRPSNGTHEIMRMTFDVQNGMVQTRNSTICIVAERTWKARK